MPRAYTHLAWQRARFNRHTSKSFITVHAGGPLKVSFFCWRGGGGGLQSMFHEERNDAKHQMIFSLQQQRQTCAGAGLRCQADPRLKQQRRSAQWFPSLKMKYNMKTIRWNRSLKIKMSCHFAFFTPTWLGKKQEKKKKKNGHRLSTAASWPFANLRKLQFHQHVNSFDTHARALAESYFDKKTCCQ